MRVTYEELIKKFQRILESRGFEPGHARTAAEILRETVWTECIPMEPTAFPK